jgi:hypothetical protein
METSFIGIDPGAKGAICVLVPATKQVAFMLNTKNPHEIFEWIKRIQQETDLRFACIEDVHSIFGTSAKSNFNFGYNTGLITGIVRSAGVSLDLVNPKKWQKHIGVPPKCKTIKKTVGDICERLYPKVNIRGPRGGLLDGHSDALMIAHYASHIYK